MVFKNTKLENNLNLSPVGFDSVPYKSKGVKKVGGETEF